MIAKHFGTVTKGRFIPDSPTDFKLAFCLLEGKRVYSTVAKVTKSRSGSQNRYYYGVPVKLLSELTGYSHGEMHDALRWKFLRVHRDGMPDTVRSTTDLTTAEFEDFLTNVRQWAAVEMGCYIPLPHEIEY